MSENHLKKAKVEGGEEEREEEEKQNMSRDKRGFMAHLRRIYKEDREPEVEGLMHELKKRRMQFYTRDDGKKTLVLVQPASNWRRGKSPQHDWPAYFKTWGDDAKDYHETYLIWSEELGAYPIAGVESLRDFLIDEEEEEGEGLPYIQ